MLYVDDDGLLHMSVQFLADSLIILYVLPYPNIIPNLIDTLPLKKKFAAESGSLPLKVEVCR